MNLFKKLFGRAEEKEIKQEEPIVQNQKKEEQVNNQNESQESMGESVKVLPRIKVDYSHEIYVEDQSKSFSGNSLPEGIEFPENQKPIVKPLYEDLILCFAVDEGNCYKILQKKIFEKNPNLNEDILQEVSVNALIAEIGEEIRVNGDPDDIMMVTAGGNFEAAIILIDNFWEQMHQIIKGNAVIAIPAKDLLFICKEDNQEAIQKLKEITKGYFDNPETQGLLSKALYLKESGNTALKILEKTF